jgi:cyclopropane-fatty-acyl-phospholipid synthase
MADAAGLLVPVISELIGTELPIRIRTWDGAEAGPPGAPVLVLHNRRALRHLIWRPDELGLARAYVAGDLDLAEEGDLFELLGILARLMEGPEAVTLRPTAREMFGPPGRRLLSAAVRTGAIGPRPPLPPEESRHLSGSRHSQRRDRSAISHHYDVGNDFYELVLGPAMTYSCARFTQEDMTLAEAQAAKHDAICRKLGLHEQPGMRLLDVGCGWGSMVLHAAEHYGVHAVGVTISTEQADLARKRVVDAGLTDRVEIRVQDYRRIEDGPFDAISSIGMAEHVGSQAYRTYAEHLYGLLRPGGRLLNHQIARRPLEDESVYAVDEFIDRYVFPDGELAPIGSTITELEAAGFEVRDMESIREHYALTLRSWVANLEAHWPEAVSLVSPARARIWRLYMAASALAFEQNNIGVNQVLAVRTGAAGGSGMPLVRGVWGG